MNENSRFIAEKIRSEYIEKETGKVQELKALDKKVKLPVNIFSYVFGSIGAVVMGTGMSLVMTDIGAKLGLVGSTMATGVVIGVIGLAMALANYPIHKKLMKSRREGFATQILELSDSIINE